MAQTVIEGDGLTFTGTDDVDDDAEMPTMEEQLATAVIAKLRQGFPKAALSAAVDLCNRIKEEHDL